MQAPFKLILVSAALSALCANAAETVDPLGPLPGETAAQKGAPAVQPKSTPAAQTPAPAPAPPTPKAAPTAAASELPAEPSPVTQKSKPLAQAKTDPVPAAKPSVVPGSVRAVSAQKTDSVQAESTAVQTPVVAAPAAIIVPAPFGGYTRTSNATFLQLDRLRSQNAVLAEEARRKELLDKLNPSTPASATVAPASPTLTTPGASGLGSNSNIHPNMVLSIYGIDDELTAVLSTTGAPLKVRVGSKVPSLGTVKSISREGVTVTTSKKTTVALEMAPISTYPGAR
ncbi:type IV pilus biogenesis protein PilP [Comamonas testosteroni]|jgi:type IV pilus biogenesis protein PilP|uniref:type IV pilus biogenesis protein PilP n=1 Tax=Comamonas testosteroni TaxID=285 RepID=UPI0026EFABB5|nr:type IV pilus biogenesis protein PilP [Comamonas testosteroni]